MNAVTAPNASTSLVGGATSEISVPEIDLAKVQKLAATLRSGSLEVVHAFGRDLGSHTAAYADTLLEQVKSKDLDLMGGRLSEIVVAAKTLNLGSLSDSRSRIPVIGGLIDKFKIKSSAIFVKFQDVRTQVDSLVKEVEGMQSGLAQRVDALELAFESVKQEYALLGEYIQAGELAMTDLKKTLADKIQTAHASPMAAQEAQDMRSALAALEKRLADIRVLQHSALQQLPMIRMVQTNNRMLIEKFYTIRELTVPAWKRQFTLALSLNEQKNAVELANTIDDATNEFLRENARLLKENTISTARANQRMVIDVETLKEVHDTLMSTVQEVVRINQEGIAHRNAATAQLQEMRRQLIQQGGAS